MRITHNGSDPTPQFYNSPKTREMNHAIMLLTSKPFNSNQANNSRNGFVRQSLIPAESFVD